VLALLNGKFYMLFSASVPYYAASYTRLFFDMTGSPAVLAVGGLVIAVIMLAYFACWQFSKNKWGWLLAATVLFGADCLFLLGFSLLAGGLVDGLLDLLFHAWVMYYLVRGCVNRTGVHTFEAAVPEQAPQTEEEDENGPPKGE